MKYKYVTSTLGGVPGFAPHSEVAKLACELTSDQEVENFWVLCPDTDAPSGYCWTCVWCRGPEKKAVFLLSFLDTEITLDGLTAILRSLTTV